MIRVMYVTLLQFIFLYFISHILARSVLKVFHKELLVYYISNIFCCKIIYIVIKCCPKYLNKFNLGSQDPFQVMPIQFVRITKCAQGDRRITLSIDAGIDPLSKCCITLYNLLCLLVKWKNGVSYKKVFIRRVASIHLYF